ncbi:translational machinery protein [Thiomonas sp.]|uniref:translational machinery protein n=1 Tax=Thiomonas sp. TaxID=2047785 RepID=UPI0026020CA2|nr:translational machinery protein [Thiomonas sp.]
MVHRHAVVWVDHSQARVLFIDPEDIERSIILPKEHPHLHVMSGQIGSGRAAEDQHYYHAVARALSGVAEVLITGPGQAKLMLFKHLQQHDPAVAQHVLGIESADHPTDAQLVAHARHYFRAKDQMLGV